MSESDDPAIHPFWRAGYAAGYEAGKAAVPKFDLGWGKPCDVCKQPVNYPTNRYMDSMFCMGDKVWHSRCVPSGGVGGTFKIMA